MGLRVRQLGGVWDVPVFEYNVLAFHINLVAFLI